NANEGNWLGCFEDNPNDRLLKSGFFDLKNDNSPENCMDYCLRVGQEVAGLENATHCFCGMKSDLTYATKTVKDDECDFYDCPGDSTETCGGPSALSAYNTGLGPIPEQTFGFVEQNSDYATEPEKCIKIAFLLQLNGRSYRQIVRLIKMIYRPQHFYYVHVDKNENYTYRKMLEMENLESFRRNDNFKVNRHRFDTIWGGTSLLDMILQSVRDLSTKFEKSKNFDYVINLSESDFPILAVEDLVQFLTYYNGTSFLKGQPRNLTHRFLQKQGLMHVFFQCESRMWRLDDRVMPKGLRLDGGSDWLVLHRSLSEYALNEEDPLVLGLRQLFRFALLPAESFFHILAANSIYCFKTSLTTSNHLRAINWQRTKGCKCNTRNPVVDWCGCSPNIFRYKTNLDRAIFRRRLSTDEAKNRMTFFARKFDPTIDQEVINKIEKRLRDGDNSRKNEHAINQSYDSYWQNLYDYKYDFDNIQLWHRLKSFFDVCSAVFYRKFICRNIASQTCDENMENSLQNIQNFSLSTFRRGDKFMGLIFGFGLPCLNDNESFRIETFLKRKNNVVKVDDLVGESYDPKEEIFRNDHGVVYSDFTDITVTFKLRQKSEKLKYTIHWIGPGNKIKVSYALNSSSKRNFYGYQLYSSMKLGPLSPGLWSVKLVVENLTSSISLKNFSRFTVAAEDQFLIWPRKLSSSFDYATDFRNIFFNKFYSIETYCNWGWRKSCRIDVGEKEQCNNTVWSTLYPDPKSQVNELNEHFSYP
uniref:protein xylosyltransferase n=1 Tax=Romanomermis culicivorax TaxID=13658 RepID=A0A915JP36_ROMCU